ncbi:MAG: hypothetical protein AAB152_06205 [Candidatus Coatesbacteria bacterium]
MPTAKQAVVKILAGVPSGASFEEIQYRIYVREKIENRLAVKRNGNVVSQEEVERRMRRWLGK